MDKRSASTAGPVGGCASLIRPAIVHVICAPLLAHPGRSGRNDMSMSATPIILYHKHPTSARTRFLRFAHGGICGFEGMPSAQALGVGPASGGVVAHPIMLVRDAERRLGLASGSLEHQSELRCHLKGSDGDSDVFVARFTAIDPPFAAGASIGAEFIDLTQARQLAPVELALLRLVYDHALG